MNQGEDDDDRRKENFQINMQRNEDRAKALKET
jgi:hypothetical protein